MAQFDSIPRMGRSQGASIFWGLVSVFFAAAACFYFWKYRENEASANFLRGQVMVLQEQDESLESEKSKLQAEISESKAREDALQEKETELTAEENRLAAQGQQSQNPQQNQSQAPVIKKFDDTVHKLAKGDDTDVVSRGGRPVLRVANLIFFALGDATLKPEGKALLDQIAKSLDGQLDNFELHLDCYTDSDGEIQKAPADAKNKPADVPKPGANAPPAPHYATTWELTAARAGTIARYLHEESSLPFQNVIVMGRADSQPIVPNAKEGHARNRRVEITVSPAPASFHASDSTHISSNTGSAAPVNPLEPPPDPPAKKGN